MSKREMTAEEIREMAHATKTCLCGALIEEIDHPGGFTYWAHVKRMRMIYGHAAIPRLPTA